MISLDHHTGRRRLLTTTIRPNGRQIPIYQADPSFIGELSPNRRWVAMTAPGAHFELDVGGVKSGGRYVDLWLERRDGSGRRRIGDGAAEIDDPEWSPDSRAVAFSAAFDEGEQVYLVQVPSGTLRRVSHAAVSCCPAWTADGRGLSYRSPNDSVVLVLSDRKRDRTLPRHVSARKIVLSRNETKALFEQRGDGSSRLEVVDLESGKVHRLTQR